jgi:uncharacterized protein (DUF305 family)
MKTVRRVSALLGALLLWTAAAAQGMGMGGMGMGPMAGGGHMMGTASTDELSFLQHMIPHHQEAIDSAQALLQVTERQELRHLLETIVETQSAEIAQMRAYLARVYPDAPHERDYHPMMRQLPAETVTVQEQAWLADMVMHHMMAVHDARSLLLLGWAQDAEIEALARTIERTQVAEMVLMRGWLVSWFGGAAAGMGR